MNDKNNLKIIQQQGIGLIELLISISVAVTILAGVLQVMATSSTNANLSDGQTRIQENLRYIINRMTQDANQAGSFGCYSVAFYQDRNVVGDILTTDNAAVAGSLNRYNVLQLIDGSNNDGTNNTDSVLFRYVSAAGGIPFESYRAFNPESTTVTGNSIQLDLSSAFDKQNYTSIDQYDVLLAASCSGAVYFMVTNNPTDNPGDIEEIRLEEGVVAPAGHLNEGQQNRVITQGHFVGAAQVFGTQLRDENDPADLEDDVFVGNWGSLNERGTRPRIYSSSFTSAVIYRIEDSLAAQQIGGECTAATPQYCALTRDGVELAEGVQDFQVEYGWHAGGNENGALLFGHAGDLSDEHWNYVDRVRITLTLNSVQQVNLDNDEDFITQNYTATIALRNQISDS